jgi:hypothetical protein
MKTNRTLSLNVCFQNSTLKFRIAGCGQNFQKFLWAYESNYLDDFFEDIGIDTPKIDGKITHFEFFVPYTVSLPKVKYWLDKLNSLVLEEDKLYLLPAKYLRIMPETVNTSPFVSNIGINYRHYTKYIKCRPVKLVYNTKYTPLFYQAIAQFIRMLWIDNRQVSDTAFTLSKKKINSPSEWPELDVALIKYYADSEFYPVTSKFAVTNWEKYREILSKEDDTIHGVHMESSTYLDITHTSLPKIIKEYEKAVNKI